MGFKICIKITHDKLFKLAYRVWLKVSLLVFEYGAVHLLSGAERAWINPLTQPTVCGLDTALNQICCVCN